MTVAVFACHSPLVSPASALRATESIQKDIEESLTLASGYYYERRASYYRNLGFRLDRVVSMARLAREFTAFALREPHTALRHSDALLLDDQHYAQIFSTRHDLDIYRLYPLAAMSAHTLTLMSRMTGTLEQNFKGVQFTDILLKHLDGKTLVASRLR